MPAATGIARASPPAGRGGPRTPGPRGLFFCAQRAASGRPGYLPPMPERLPPPGPSYLRELEFRTRDRTLRVGMTNPSTTDDGWWLALLWVVDDEGVVSFRDVAPVAGPPADPPIVCLGPRLAGGLSGFIREEDGRLALRLGPVVPPDDPNSPWDAPAVVRAAFRWEPARAATLRPTELASAVLGAFRQAVQAVAGS